MARKNYQCGTGLHFETIQSHDHAPCTIAWRKSLLSPNRPPASIQIYYTAPSAASPEKGPEFAHSLMEEGPMQIKGKYASFAHHYRDRLDIYGLAMDASIPEQERIERCISHHRREIADREAKGRVDLHVMQWHFGNFEYKRFIVVVEKEIEDWEEGEMVFVFFDPIERSGIDDVPLPPIDSYRVEGLRDLESEISHYRRSLEDHAMDAGEFDDDYSVENLQAE